MKKLLKNKQLWGGLIAVVLLIICFKSVKLTDINSLFHRLNYHYFIPSVLCSFAFLIVRALRWRVMITRQAPCGAVRTITLYAAGQVINMAMPVLTGQVGRLLLYAKKLDLRKTFVFSTMVLEVIFDALSLLIFMFFTSLAFAFPKEYRLISFIVAGLTALVLLLMYLMLNYQQKLEEVGRRRLAKRWPGFYVGLKKGVRSFAKGIELLRSSQHMATSILLSLLAWTSHVMVIWLLYESFGFKLPVAAAAAVVIVNAIVLMIPITPGNAGTFEIVVSSSLTAFSVGRADAVLFALALHLIDLVPVITLGAFFFRKDRNIMKTMRQISKDKTIINQIGEDGGFLEEEKV